MGAHTPKRDAVERFIKTQSEHAHGIEVKVIDEQQNPIILLEANASSSAPRLEIHTRQITLTNEQLDPSTQKMITRWLDSLSSGAESRGAIVR
ncbi:MAG: hypothetical protein JO061_18110 [Acidobacteriaceae bacterium]|nr:hypothetical protein [Acidobacteriaceae bacterium]